MMLKATRPFKIVVANALHAAGWELLQATEDVSLQGPFDCQEDFDTK